MVDVFEERSKLRSGNKDIFEERADLRKKSKKQEPLTLKGSAGSYGAGFGGGAGGFLPDITSFFENITPAGMGLGLSEQGLGKTPKHSPIKGTHELTKGIREEFGLPEEPQNALERILQQSGEFGGMEGLIGTGIGGPASGLAGTLHGSASGALYGGLKELGMDDEWALGVTMLATVSPIAAQKLWPKLVNKFKSGSTFQEGMKAAEKEFAENLPPGSPSPGSQVIPAGRSGFELAEEALGELQKPEFESGKKLGRKLENKPVDIKFPSLPEEAKPLTGRVKVLQEETVSSISPERFYNEKHGGTNLSGLAKKELDKASKVVRKKYKSAEKAYAGKNDIFPEIALKTEEALQSLYKTAEPSTAEKAVIKQLEALQKMVGYPQALAEVGLDRLIKTADSISQLLNYEVAGGGVKNILKSFVKDLNKSVIGSLERQGAKAHLLKDADRAYAQMADRFFNDEIKGFLEKRIRNPESLYRKALQDEGTYRAVKDALGPKNSKSIAKLERGIGEEAISPYLKDPSKIGSKEYNDTMANLEGLIGKQKTANVKSKLERKKVTTPPKHPKEAKTKLHSEKITSSTQMKASKYLGKTPEVVEKMMNSRSGIRQLREDLNNKGLPNLFDKLAEEKFVEISRAGDVSRKKITRSDLHDEVVKPHNYDIISEIYGREAAERLIEETAEAARKNKYQKISIEIVKVVARLLGAGKLVKIGSVISKGL